MRISKILEGKSKKIVSIDGHAPVSQAVAEMLAANVGSVLVLMEDTVEGIFTERDALRLWNERNKPDNAVMKHMSKKLVITGPDHTVEEALSIMNQKNIRHLIVVEGKKILNVISMKDIIKAYAGSLKADIQYLDKLTL